MQDLDNKPQFHEKYYDVSYLVLKMRELLTIINFIQTEINDIIYDSDENDKKSDNRVQNFIEKYGEDNKSEIELYIDQYVEQNECFHEEEQRYKPGWILQGFSDDGKSLLFYLVAEEGSFSKDYLEKKRAQLLIEKCRYYDGFEECALHQRWIERKCCRFVNVPLEIFNENKRSKILYFFPMNKYVTHKLGEYYDYIKKHTDHDPDSILESLLLTT